MAEKGYAALPTYTPIQEHVTMGDDQLILTTYKVNVQSHSRTQNCKWLTEIYHENPAWINPVTAEKLGIGEGDQIKLKSVKGELQTFAQVTPGVVPA